MGLIGSISSKALSWIKQARDDKAFFLVQEKRIIMKKIGINREIFEYFDRYKLWIRDSTIIQINTIRDGYYINIEITLKLVGSKKLLTLKFEKVQSFNFSGYAGAM